MISYEPTYISGNSTGLVQGREDFLLPEDGYPNLENAYVWRERIKRKQGYQLLGRLRRILTTLSLGNTVALQTTYTFPNIFASFVPPIGSGETNKEIEPGSLIITIGPPDTATFTDNGDGTFTVTGAGVSLGSSVNYVTGAVTIVLSVSIGGSAITANINYFPGLPVMGLRNEQLNGINANKLIAFDQIYAYTFVGTGFQEFLPGTIWTGQDFEFFWSTNYWVDKNALNIFWVTNDSSSGDPIRYTNGQPATNWINFTPTINVAGDKLEQALCILPFRSRLVVFNTKEAGIQFNQRIRWAAIGTPFSDVSAIVTAVNENAWRDDIRGQGGFLDIPTSDFIVSVGFVRDNLVIFCENSTWQLRYTGNSIAPFQVEKVNSELGVKSTFSQIQFDTSLLGVGDKGIVECDSYRSERIDIKIPDLIFEFNDANHGTERVHGIRDFQQRLAYWTYPYFPDTGFSTIYPNRVLVYNYENDSWAIFTDSFTTLGTFQPQNPRTWATTKIAWSDCDFPWVSIPSLFPQIIAGNQQGFVEFFSSNLDPQVSNDISLSITALTGNNTIPTVVTSPNHNMQTGQVISISNIPIGTPFASTLNGNKFGIVVIDANNFQLWIYNPTNGAFDIPQLDSSSNIYVGGGKIALRDGFSIISKKFNVLDQGQQIQLGYVDILMNNTASGAISMNVYMNYNSDSAVNIEPQNDNPATNKPDEFFNVTIPTNFENSSQGIKGSKNWQRIFCPVRGQFITIEYTLSNGQLIGIEQESEVQIDAQILWLRPAGRLI